MKIKSRAKDMKKVNRAVVVADVEGAIFILITPPHTHTSGQVALTIRPAE